VRLFKGGVEHLTGSGDSTLKKGDDTVGKLLRVLKRETSSKGGGTHSKKKEGKRVNGQFCGNQTAASFKRHSKRKGKDR